MSAEDNGSIREKLLEVNKKYKTFPYFSVTDIRLLELMVL